MSRRAVLLVLGMCAVSSSPSNNSTDKESLVSTERHRRLIPYMTYYFSRQQFGNQPQFHQLSGATSYASNNLRPSVPYAANTASYTSNKPRVVHNVPHGTKSTFYSINSGPYSPQKTQYSTNNAPYFSNNVPYPENNLPYSTNNVPYFPNNSPHFVNKQYGGSQSSPQAVNGASSKHIDNGIPGSLKPTSFASSGVHYHNNLPSLDQGVHTVAATVTPSPTAALVHNNGGYYQQTTPHNDDYHPQTTPQANGASDNTLTHILDLLRDTGRLPSQDVSQRLYRPAATTPAPQNIADVDDYDVSQRLYRPAATTEAPRPLQNIADVDDYEYYDDDVDIPVPKTQFVKLTPLKVPFGTSHQNFPASEGGTPGKPGIDYPILAKIPATDFDCKNQRYKGFFGDPDTNCQVWHYCDLNGGQASFLCPNGTIFSQVGLTCDWWFNVRCESTVQLYVLNERLYKYILPATPSFPEDYSGPVVDRYLTLKFQEKEAKRIEKERKET